MSNKTLIGKNNYLFLINDSCKELQVHCNNLIMISDMSLSRYTFDNYMLVIFPNKSLIYKDLLPIEYTVKYRPGFKIYKDKFNNNLIDGYELLKNERDTYYKTDTHINLKGNYIIYISFINKVNEILHLQFVPKKINILSKQCKLSELPYGIGDLTWSSNLGDQQLNDVTDTYYFSNDIDDFYNIYKIKNDNNIKFLNYNLIDRTQCLEDNNEFANWNIISQYIIYVKNINKYNISKINKVIIFYDSFLLNILPLYFDLFYELYFIKTVYDNNLIDMIKPDYVFEFKVERFLF